MDITNTDDFNYEANHLFNTLNYLNAYKTNIISRKTKVDSIVEYGITHYNSDNAEQFNDLTIYSTLQGSINAKLRQIAFSLDKPYFARFDFKETQENKIQGYYLGKMSLYNEASDEFVIIDWRSPIASLYYEQRLGNASYECVDGIINGELSLKRQYFIESGQLKNIMDIDITTNDAFLQAALGSNKDNRLKDIVTTIQAEQNKVIRAYMWSPLIVQGAAGGGKTTIALHRIAYLMYNNEKTLKANNFMIIAPNKFFLSYISEVLPELGVENVTQTTYEDLIFSIIGPKYKLIPPFEKLSQIIALNYEDNIQEANKIQRAAQFKSSLIYANLILRYLRNLELNYLPKEDFKINNYVLFSYSELQKRFLRDFGKKPFYKRVLELKKSLLNKLSLEKDRVLKQIENSYEISLNKVRSSMEDSIERRKIIISIIDERDETLAKTKNKSKTIIREYFSKIPKKDCYSYYSDFINNLREYNKENIKEEILNTVYEDFICNTSKKSIEFEDLAPLAYLHINIYGLDDKLDVRHIIIDEAQDFSLFQILSLQTITHSDSFTILGDLCQGIYSYRGIRDWSSIANRNFINKPSSFLTLEQSYRTTMEIMEVANKVIEKLNATFENRNLPQAKPVIRHGKNVEIHIQNSFKEICSLIDVEISLLNNKGFKSMAIITKTLEECKKAKKHLKNDITIITGKEENYTGGIVLIPCFLAKGLEFDMVIILNASDSIYRLTELDMKLLYVAMTRPLHELQIYSLGNLTPILE